MGIKADLKAARVRMQAGAPAEALTIIQAVLDASPPELQDPQLKYAFLITAGLAYLAAEDFSASENRFREAAASLPDAPQAWKGLIECLERGGKVEALPECLGRAAEIAEGKGNFARARSLRLRLGQVLESLARPEEALEALLKHLDSPEANPIPNPVLDKASGAAETVPGKGGAGLAGEERLSMLLLVAILEASKEDVAVARRVEKRLEKAGTFGAGLTASAASSAAGAPAAGAARSRTRSVLLSEYRAKALAKDAAEGSPVGSRLADAIHALEESRGAAICAPGGKDATGATDVTGITGPDPAQAQKAALKVLVERFCRAFLGRAVQIAESSQQQGGVSTAGGAGTGGAWQGVLDAGVSVKRAVGGVGGRGDGAWAATATLLASSYAHVDQTELWRLAQEGAEDAARRPWLSAEACLHLAGMALSAGDGLEADKLLQAAAAAAASAAVAPASATATGRTPQSTTVDAWKGMSGPGSNWRELSLRCLVDEKLGYPGARRDPKAALARVDEAVAAFEDSRLVRGVPGGQYGDLLGRLALARASLLLGLGRLDDARSAAEDASSGVVCGGGCGGGGAAAGVHSSDKADSPAAHGDGDSGSGSGGGGGGGGGGGNQAEVRVHGPGEPPGTSPEGGGGDAGRTTTPCIFCSARCVASDVDAAEGDFKAAKAKLREVLDAHAGFADALSRLGWLLLGYDGGGAAGKRGMVVGRSDLEAARPLLERAVGREPGSSSHAFRLARCYWELGDEFREDRNYCFNALLKAAKLSPSNAEAFEWLGHWYQGVGGDRERARGCFLRSVKLDPEMRGAGEALALLYLENGQEALAVSLFRQCAAVSTACHWAWAALGRTKVLEGKLAEASSHIQQAIRGCPTSWSYWSDLGWCYHAEGKQAAALKAYTRAEELLTDQGPHAEAGGGSEGGDGSAPPERPALVGVELTARVRVKTQVGTIQRQIGQVDEAVKSFTGALALDPNSGLALEGAGEAYLAQAHARTSEGLYTAAVTALRLGSDVTRRFLAADGPGNVGSEELRGSDELKGSGLKGSEGGVAGRGGGSKACALKLLGDLHTYGHKLPPMSFEGEGARESGGVRERGTVEAAEAGLGLSKQGSKNRQEFVARGAAAYQQLVQMLRDRVVGADGSQAPSAGEAVEVTPASALYDLGLNYLLRARLLCADSGEGSGLWAQDVYEQLPGVKDLARPAEQAFKQAIEAEPSHSDAWNGLGVVSRDPLVKQHCFVRAVQLEHNPSAWANLGMLYLRWGLDAQAYGSFGGLQAVTDHPTMWVGLGLLKEKEACGPDVAAAKRRRLLSQASDAYYSSLETGQHVDGLLGLGTTAGRTHSQADALVAIEQHLDLNPNSAQAWNHLGAAAEFAGRQTQAVAAYRRALSLLEEQGDTLLGRGEEEETKSAWKAAVQLANGNLGRVLVLQGEADEALSLLGEGDLTQADTVLQTGRARALMGDWDGAFAVLEQGPAGGRPGVDGLISAAATLYHRGDKRGAAAAAGALMARYPQNRRVLHAAVSLGALSDNTDMTEQASRLLQMLPKRPTASDGNGQLARSQVEEDLWATHLALRAAGAPSTLSRRALSKAVHLSPSSTRSWARLGAVAADATALTEPSPTGAPSPAPDDTIGSKLAEACVSTAEKQAMFGLLGKARGGGAGVGVGAGAGAGSVGGGAAELSAREIAGSLLGFGKARLSGGGRKGGAATGAAKACARAVHMYPAETTAWRLLAASLVDEALSSTESAAARDLLGRAQVIYGGISDASCEPTRPPLPPGQEEGLISLSSLEADYCGLLLSADQASATAKSEEKVASTASSTTGSSNEGQFGAHIMAARTALCRGETDAVGGYKLALRAQPTALVGWRELAACYELSDQHHASVTALECGARTASAGKERGSPSAAPLHLQMAKSKLSAQQDEEEGLRSVGDAFRSGKGGVVGHVMRGLMNLRLGKGALATNAFAKAKEADPAVTDFVDMLAVTD